VAVTKADAQKAVNDYFSGTYKITKTDAIPTAEDLPFGKEGKQIDLAMLFIDIRESTAIVDASRRTTAARMYKSFLWGVTKFAKENSGEICSFNGDGVLVAFAGGRKCNSSVKAALGMKWFSEFVLKPKMDSYFDTNQQLVGSEFDFGIGIDTGTILVVRGGIKGDNNNDLVWVGNATNRAVKLSGEADGPNHVRVSKEVYSVLDHKDFGNKPLDQWWTWGYSTALAEHVYQTTFHLVPA
jgi:adenylate cyclase